jgi:hypothetical protein
MNPKITLVVIARNEERDLPRCLSSCSGFAGEMIVVDSDSSDGTCEAAVRCGARVLQHDFEDYSKQKQWACEQASGEWILVLDADEEAPSGLGTALEAAVARRPGIKAWRIRRRTCYLGKMLRFGPWMGDAPVRLFRRGCARFGDEEVHEKIRAEGDTPVLRGVSIAHRPYADASEHIAKMSHYARLWAIRQAASGRKACSLDPILRASWRLLRAMILQLAFLDGFPGVAAASSSAVYAYWKWLMLWELTKAEEGGGRSVNLGETSRPRAPEGG